MNRIQKFDDVLNTPRLLFRDLGIFLMFTVVFVYVLFYRRDVKTVFTINHYVSQQLTGQPFGAYRQLTVQDIATPEHVWEVRSWVPFACRATRSGLTPMADCAVATRSPHGLPLHHPLLQ